MELYQPSNGTEGCEFTEKFCDLCHYDRHFRKDQTGGCPLILLTMTHDVIDDKYPKQWTFDKNGDPVCTKFKTSYYPRKVTSGERRIKYKIKQEKAGQLRLF